MALDQVNLLGNTPGTLAEHDIMISISEESINKQLKELYDKPVESGALPPPPGTKFNDRPQNQPSRYFINHELQILHIYHKKGTGERVFDPKTGIFGHIKCPIVSLKEKDPDVARITFEFERVATASTPDSEFKFYSGAPPDFEVESKSINGWKMSWCVNVDRHVFKDLKELVDDAKDASSSTVTHPETLKTLQNFKGEEFTACSIFCIFDDVQIANSFELIDDSGKKPEISAIFMAEVTQYFKDLQAVTPKGKASTDHPFVLGYGLVQTVPELEKRDPTPQYFIPSEIRRTVSPGLVNIPGKDKPEDSKFTRGTLNFCVLTLRGDSQAPTRNLEKHDIYKNRNSGRLTQTLFDLTLTAQHDGVMGIAQDLIWTTYLVPILKSNFYINVDNITQNDIEDKPRTTSNYKTDSWVTDSSRPGHFWRTSYDFNGGKKGTFKDDDVFGDVKSIIRAEWTSDLQTNRDKIGEKDAARRAFIKVENEIFIEYFFRYNFTLGSNLFATRIDVATKTMIEVTPGQKGLLRLEVKGHEGPTYKSDGGIDFTDGRHSSGSYGAWIKSENDSGKGPLDKLWDNIKRVIEAMAKAISDSISEKLKLNVGKVIDPDKKVDFSSIGNRYIMPAGAVFNFSGIDLDYDGNMYSHISFALGTGGVSDVNKPGDLVK